MTIVGKGFEVAGDAFDLSYRKPPLSDRSHQPILIGIGDRTYGPVVGLFFDGPSTPEELMGPTDLTPSHSHPCDNFRIVMKGELWVGQERYHQGEFRIQRSARPYGADGDAPHREGNWRIISFADRRGSRVRPTNPEMRAQVENEDALAKMRAMFDDLMPEILPPNDPGIDGLVTTIDKPWSKVQHIDSRTTDAYMWPEIGEGARVAVSLMSHHEVGPVYVIQRTPAGAQATPAMTFGSDVFRCVIAGSHTRNGEVVEMGDCRFQAGGIPWERVVAGPEGLDEVIIVGDRTGYIPEVTGDDPSGWASTFCDIVEGLKTRLKDPITLDGRH
jgi:hypothetical protein